MKDFVAIDFETANPKRVSACALGYTIVKDGEIIESNGFLMKPIGGHAPFQTKIHGINETHTAGQPDFGEVFATINHLFGTPVVGHSMFDKQVLNALSDEFRLGICYEYTDSVSVARQQLPHLKNHKLKTLAKHFQLPNFKHHDATEDARTCAEIFLRLNYDQTAEAPSSVAEFSSLAAVILADEQVDYKEACQLMYWLEDHRGETSEMDSLLTLVKSTLEDDVLEDIEADAIQAMLKLIVHRHRNE